jgi:oxygen-independent coproporphyrinogen-3 oxidase
MMQEGNQKHNQSLGLYVHVPFCSSTCDFCAFYQERPSKKKIESYFLALRQEMKQSKLERLVDTVFIGGGTPGLLQAEELRELCQLIQDVGVCSEAEWTIELAPNEVTPKKLSVLKMGGVNRVSLGVQTFDSKLMNDLGRKHGPPKVFQAYHHIREAGFESVNLDLIFGIPHQTLDQWESDMEEALRMKPEHISTYCLTFEEDTALYYRLAKGELSIDPDKEAQYYERAWDFLPSRGYKQYEISNFAIDGMACQHNLNTWNMNEWLGLGPSACSQISAQRRKNPSNLEEWSGGISNGRSHDYYEEFEQLSPISLAEDALLFGLRMNQGVYLPDISARFGLPSEYFEEINQFFSKLGLEGLAEKVDNWVRLTPAGRVLADAIAAEMPVFQDG